jgi:hypothetical protein
MILRANFLVDTAGSQVSTACCRFSATKRRNTSQLVSCPIDFDSLVTRTIRSQPFATRSARLLDYE